MLLEKYPEILNLSYYGTLIEDVSLKVFERAIHHYHQQQYKTARQYLVFLQKIRNIYDKPGLIDLQINQLLKYVDQANALNLIGLSKKGLIPKANEFTENSKLLQNGPAGYSLVNAIKPYIPSIIKEPLKRLRKKIISPGKY